MALFPDEFPFKKPKPQPEVRSGSVAAVTVPSTASAAMPAAQQVAIVAPPPTPVPKPPPPRPTAAELQIQERRRAVRQPLWAKASLRPDNHRGLPYPVELQDLSLMGVRFHTDAEMQTGEKAQIRLEAGPLRWATRLMVIHCREESAGIYLVGCAFIGNELVRPFPVAA